MNVWVLVFVTGDGSSGDFASRVMVYSEDAENTFSSNATREKFQDEARGWSKSM